MLLLKIIVNLSNFALNFVHVTTMSAYRVRMCRSNLGHVTWKWHNSGVAATQVFLVQKSCQLHQLTYLLRLAWFIHFLHCMKPFSRIDCLYGIWILNQYILTVVCSSIQVLVYLIFCIRRDDVIVNWLYDDVVVVLFPRVNSLLIFSILFCSTL